MLIFTIIVTILLVLALLFIGWIFLDGYLNPSISASTTIENFDPKEWNRAEFVDQLHHFAHHNRLDDQQKLMSLRMLIDKEYDNMFGGEKE